MVWTVKKNSLSNFFLIVIILSGLFLVFTGHFSRAQSGTNVNSVIGSNTTWTQTGSPYNLLGPTLVSSGVTLTIEAGAIVNLNTYYLQINGTLVVNGTIANPVIINSSATNAGQIEFTASSTSWDQQSGFGCIIENAVINQTVISVTNCSVMISGNVFNDAAGMTYENVAITTTGGASIISNNTFNACGLNLSDNSTISNNVITGGMGIYGGFPVVSGNSISGGSSYFFIGRDWDRDYYTVAIEDQSSPTLINNTIASIAFNMNGNGYAYNIFNAIIEGNTIGGIGIGGGSGTVVISNNLISGSGITGNSAISTTITNNLIINTNIGLQIGDAVVQNNTIIKSQIAISLNSAVSPTIIWNNIENSSQYNIKLSGTSNNINASNNWWGTTDPQAINQTIYDFKDDFNLGNVSFIPYLTAPNPAAPTIPLNPVLATSVTPVSWTMDEGQSKTFTANPAGGSGTYTGYQWYVDGSAQSGKTASTFTYTATSMGSHLITATVTDNLGFTSNQSSASSVTVNSYLSVLIGSGQTLDVGQSKMFTASVIGGTSGFSYQWYLNNVAVGGQTSSTYTFIPSTVGSNTVFCNVTDSASTPLVASSFRIMVTVDSALTTPSVSPSPVTVSQGQTSSLTSPAVTTGTSPYTYQWFNEAPGSSSYSSVAGAISSSYGFVTSTSTATGSWNFILQVTDNAGAATNSTYASVSVNAATSTPTPTPTSTASQTLTPATTPTATSHAQPSPTPTAPEFPSVTITFIALSATSTAILLFIRKSKK